MITKEELKRELDNLLDEVYALLKQVMLQKKTNLEDGGNGKRT